MLDKNVNSVLGLTLRCILKVVRSFQVLNDPARVSVKDLFPPTITINLFYNGGRNSHCAEHRFNVCPMRNKQTALFPQHVKFVATSADVAVNLIR